MSKIKNLLGTQLQARYEKWKQENDDLLMPGLDQIGKTYVRLKHVETPTIDLDLAFKPVIAVSPIGIAVGAKIAVFPCKGSEKVKAVNADARINWMETAFPKFDFVKRNADRVGTVVVGALSPTLLQTIQDSKTPSTLLEEMVKSMTASMLESIAEKTDIDERERVQAAIAEVYEQCLRAALEIPYGDVQAAVPDNVVAFAPVVKNGEDSGNVAPLDPEPQST